MKYTSAPFRNYRSCEIHATGNVTKDQSCLEIPVKRNGRLSLALHTLGHMAGEPGRMRTSADIAAHAGTNPVVVRRVLGQLRKAGLLVSETGHAGGWRLARTPEKITLADVYVALDERLIAVGNKDDVPSCSLEHALHRRIADVLEDVERSLIERLRTTTISQVREAGA